MRIHSNTLTDQDIVKALAKLPGVGMTTFGTSGSRSHARAFEIKLSGTSSHRQNFGGENMAATWDEWGMFLGDLFRMDPTIKATYYASAEEFHWRTADRFNHDVAPLTPDRQHMQHKWGMGRACITGSYSVAECGCGATQRWMLRGSFADLSMA